MNFEEHFLPQDVPLAKLTFNNLIQSLRLIEHYTLQGETEKAKKMSMTLMEALESLNDLAVRKESSKQMYLHHLLNKPQGWYPN